VLKYPIKGSLLLEFQEKRIMVYVHTVGIVFIFPEWSSFKELSYKGIKVTLIGLRPGYENKNLFEQMSYR